MKRKPLILLILGAALILTISAMSSGRLQKIQDQSALAAVLEKDLGKDIEAGGAGVEVVEKHFGAASLKHLRHLDEMGARPAGTPQEKAAADYIFDQLASMGYKPERQAFAFTHGHADHERKIASENIIVQIPGTSTQQIIVGAHYDSVAAGNGADDNASGAALLLEACELVKDRPMSLSIRFIFFGAEETGSAGSKHYLQQLTKAEEANILAVLNFDSLIAGDKIYAHGSFGRKGIVRDWMLRKAELLDIPLVKQTGKTGCQRGNLAHAVRHARLHRNHFSWTGGETHEQPFQTVVCVSHRV